MKRNMKKILGFNLKDIKPLTKKELKELMDDL